MYIRGCLEEFGDSVRFGLLLVSCSPNTSLVLFVMLQIYSAEIILGLKPSIFDYFVIIVFRNFAFERTDELPSEIERRKL